MMVGEAKKTDPDTLHEDALTRFRKVESQVATTESALRIVQAERAQIGAKMDQMDDVTAKRYENSVKEHNALKSKMEDLGYALADADREVKAADAYRRKAEADRMRSRRKAIVADVRSDLEEMDRVIAYSSTLASRIEENGNAISSMSRLRDVPHSMGAGVPGGKGLLEACARSLLKAGWHTFLQGVPGGRSYKTDGLTLSDRAAAVEAEVNRAPVVLD